MAATDTFLFGPIQFTPERQQRIGEPVVVRHPQIDDGVPVEQLAAVWCEAANGYTLFEAIGRVRPLADRLQKPVAIYSGETEFPLSVAGRVQRGDQFWMRCSRRSRDTAELSRFKYEHELEYCPIDAVVLVVDVDGDDRLTTENLAVCGELSARGDVVGLVWFGEPSPAALVALQQLAHGVPWAAAPVD